MKFVRKSWEVQRNYSLRQKSLRSWKYVVDNIWTQIRGTKEKDERIERRWRDENVYRWTYEKKKYRWKDEIICSKKATRGKPEQWAKEVEEANENVF